MLQASLSKLLPRCTFASVSAIRTWTFPSGYQVRWGLDTDNMNVASFPIRHHQHSNTHAQHTDWWLILTYKYILTPTVMCSKQLSLLDWISNSNGHRSNVIAFQKFFTFRSQTSCNWFVGHYHACVSLFFSWLFSICRHFLMKFFLKILFMFFRNKVKCQYRQASTNRFE